MSDVKWIKITTNMFEDEKIRLIDAMPERDTIHYIWIRLLVQAGKNNANGFIFLSENIPYTDEMLSTIFCRPLTSIRLALKTLKDFGMIEVAEDNLIKITNWEKHQNVEGLDKVREQNKIRAKNYRDKKKQLKAVNENEDIEDISSSENQEEIVQNSNEIESNVTQKKCNVMQNENNVIVTEQNKRESKNQKKNQKKNKNSIIDREKENNNTNSLSQEKQNINLQANKLLKYYENITGMIGDLNLSAIKLAISKHGFDNVKMAVDKALEVNKADMTYINGILKNWKREGYPNNEGAHKSNNNKSGSGLKFDNFEAREYDYNSLEKELLGWGKIINDE
ncbi:DnaD domain protein [Clostridium botulinum]|uniref:phage replisome organizer N-terminal domain-containing protein n=1 Tax=Clostridium botulinum TaxID=1491 RepID=UPI0007743199|nr:phage replisome organizer N-terminal domain-containing protein [Clostridium botulinum]NFH79638.1 DnaD domain protein [Clostridium botulinum]NFH82517.1 DnaD domain protein [Clostridium botulinum]NFI11222.1 DnaD domain protein [Clostridium botulinum]NFI13543.1 DnaD domain protein [Clostridium botulinum]NFO83501.1 DnaD domain protein [Clostridium botulinum]